MRRYLIFILGILTVTLGCRIGDPPPDFAGFWEGPHPEDANKKFYIRIELAGDSVAATGYWTNHNFYQESFAVDSLLIRQEDIAFQIQDWGCQYRGSKAGKDEIAGGFDCEGEPFDSVNFVRNNHAKKYLIESKPGANEDGYTYAYSEPEDLADGVTVSRYESLMDSVFIFSLMQEIIKGNFGRLNSFLLFKNNHLICEEYFFGYTRSDLHPIESSTKSVTSLLIGIASDKGYLSTIILPLSEIFPEHPHLLRKGYSRITVKDLLTMTSGYFPDERNLFRSDDRIAFALQRELVAMPGDTFQYDGGNTEILGGIIRRTSGMFADELALKYLFEPLEISDYNWELNKQKGYPSMSGALHLRPRDMGKLGQLVLNKGVYSGRQVIPEQWIDESTSLKTSTRIPGEGYSYQWWNLNLASGGNNYSCIWANGWGSQFIYIFPELEVVIVTTGHNYEGDSWGITKGISDYLYLLDN